jgi:L-ascorbate metabolism protein UlaG (beta-lactamase superfamily)
MARFATVAHRLVAAAGLSGLFLAAAQAQTPAPGKPEMRESCPGLIASDRPPAIPAAYSLAALADGQVRISYSGHSTFILESPKLVRIATDYNDYLRPPATLLPDIVTMNHAHSTHYTDHPDPDIKFVLRGWRDDGEPANHDITFGDVRVRSVSTNIRNWNGGTEYNGNSIFIFEMGKLCIAHLGHRIDVLLVPVDGAYTMDIDGMIEVVQSIKAPLMIPMHFFSTSTLHRFLDRVGRQYDVEYAEVPTTVVSKETLPTKPKFLVLPGH